MAISMMSLGDYEMIESIWQIIGYICIPILLVGVLQAFFGYKLFKIYNCLTGFVFGGLIGAVLGALAFRGSEGAFLGAVIFGILGAVLANLLYAISVFISSFFSGFLVGVILAVISSYDSHVISTALAYGVICGLLFGFISCFMAKYAIMIETSINGGMLSALAMKYILQSKMDGLVAGVLIAVIGLIVQLFTNQQKNRRTMQNIVEYSENSGISNENPKVNNKSFNITINAGGAKDNFESGTLIDEKMKLKDAFQNDIYDEIFRVFHDVSKTKLIYMPVFHEDDSWMCSCGNVDTKEECIFCGMKRDEARNKINYAYLKESLKKRKESEKEEARRKRSAFAEKEKAVREKVRGSFGALWKNIKQVCNAIGNGLKKKWKFILMIIIIIVLMIAVGFALVHNRTLRMKYYVYKAQNCSDVYDKIDNYRNSIDEKPNLDAYLELIQLYLDRGEFSEASICNEDARELYASNKEYISFEQSLKPGEIVISPDHEQKYDTRITIEMSETDRKYNSYIIYSVNNESEKEYQQPFTITKSGEYDITAYIVNDLGYVSPKVTAHYSVDIEVPEDITSNLKEEYYSTVTNIELYQSEGEKIYYTLDGSTPTKDSLVYRKPIECNFGAMNIKAICYNKNGEKSKVFEKAYYVSNGSSRIAGRTNFIGYYYDYIVNGDYLYILDKQNGEVVETYSNAFTPYEYEGKLYYSQNDGTIYSIDVFPEIGNLTTVRESGGFIDQMVVMNDCVYYIEDNTLYSIGIDGTNNELIDSDINSSCFAIDDDKIYYCDLNNQVKVLQNGNIDNYEILDQSPSSLAVVDKVIYYISSGSIYKMKKGKSKTLFEAISDEEEIPQNGLEGRIESSTIYSYPELQINGNILLVKEYYAHDWKQYGCVFTNSVNKSSSVQEYRWIALNVENGNRETVSSNENCVISDECIYNDIDRVSFNH